jgi:hypothetical protein
MDLVVEEAQQLQQAVNNNCLDPDAKNFISLDKVWDMFRWNFLNQNIYNNTDAKEPYLLTLQTLLEQKDFTLDKAIEYINVLYESQDKPTLLRQLFEEAKNSIFTETPMLWQTFVRDLDIQLDSCFYRLSGEDQERFMNEVRPVFNKLAYGMVQSNAEKILALMESGHLEVRTLGKNFSIDTVTQGETVLPGAEINYFDKENNKHKDYYSTVVNANGDPLHGLSASSELLTSLFKNHYAEELMTVFKNQEAAKKRYELEQQENPRIRTVREIGDVYYRAGGGLLLDMPTFEIIPSYDSLKEPNTNLFASGVLSKGMIPVLEGFGTVDSGMDKILKTIIGRIMEERGKNFNKNIRPYLLIENPFIAEGLAIIPDGASPGNIAAIEDSVRARLGTDAIQITIIPASKVPNVLKTQLPPNWENELKR